MKLAIVFLIFLVSISNVESMHITPNNILVYRGSNFSFEAIATQDFTFYTIDPNDDRFIYTAKRNQSTITVDVLVPIILEIKAIYEFKVQIYDKDSYPLTNATFLCGIGNLSDKELFNLLLQYRDILNESSFYRNQTEALEDALKDRPKPKPNFFEKYFSYIVTIGISCVFLSIVYGISNLQTKANANKRVKETEDELQTSEEDKAKLLITKRAYSFTLNEYKPIKTKDGIKPGAVLNRPEYEQIKHINRFRDLLYFVRVTPKIQEQFNKKDISSKELCINRLSEAESIKSDDYKKWLVWSGICKGLEDYGLDTDKSHGDLKLTNCTFEDMLDYLGTLKDNKEMFLAQLSTDDMSTEDESSHRSKQFKKSVLTLEDENKTQKQTLEQKIKNYKSQ